MGTENDQPVDSVSNDIALAIQQLSGEADGDDDRTADEETNSETQSLEETEEQELTSESDQEIESEDGDSESEVGESESGESNLTIDAPHSWNADAKKMFNELPEDAKAYIAERETDRDSFLNKKAQELSSVRRKYDSLDDVLSQHRTKYQMSGLDDAGIIRQQFALTEALSNNPSETIGMLATQFGVDLQTVGQEEEATDPAMKKIAELETKLNNRDETAQQQRVVQFRKHVDSIANEKDANGELVRPRFDELKPVIAKLMSSRMASNVAEAYEKAEKLTTSKTPPPTPNADAQTNKANQVKKAKRAKQAAVGVKSSTSKSKANADLSLRGEIANAIGNNKVKF